MFDIKRTDSKVVQENPTSNILNQSSDNLYASNLSCKRVPQLNKSRQDLYREDLTPDQLQKGSQKNARRKQQQLKNSKILTSLRRLKLSHTLKQTLIKRAMDSGNFKAKKSTQKVSNLTKSIFEKIGKQQITCGICIGLITQQDVVKLCQCPHVYCKSCIRDYVTYKIKTFEQVFCPQEQCHTVMNQSTQFYKNLPEQIKKQYVKLHNFYVTSNDPSLKLCPKQSCEGIIKILQNQLRICGTCKHEFCPQCNFQKHSGNCQQQEIDFFHNHLHYRQCQNCKTVVQRTEGCNHMTCRCRYEFCYLCGNKWKGYDHKCNQTIAQIRVQNGGMFGNGGPLECCNCEDNFGYVCGYLVTIPLRLFLGLLIGFFFGCILIRNIILTTFYLAGSILAGIFAFTPDLLCDLCHEDCCIFILFLLLPIIPIFIGIFRALREMFCNLTEQLFDDYCDSVQIACRNLWA